MEKLKTYLISGVIISLLVIGFFAGYKTYPALKPCQDIHDTTIYITDDSWHTIEDSLELTIDNLEERVVYWKKHQQIIQLPGDTIPVPVDVDTAAILKDHYSKYAYSLTAENDTIAIKDSLIITQNVPVWNELSYKFKIPFVTINNKVDNSVYYTNYLQFGTRLPVYTYSTDSINKINLANLTLDLRYIWSKGYVGVAWQPNKEAVLIETGINILKIKSKK